MKVDTLLAALAVMRQRLMVVDGVYTADQVQRRLLTISMMREHVLAGNTLGFTAYCQGHLAGTLGDHMVDVLEELYEELGIGDTAMWDEFSTQFLDAQEA